MELLTAQLRRTANVAGFDFEPTAQLDNHDGRLDQRRAKCVLDFAISKRFSGYNLNAVGSPQTGILDCVREHLVDPWTSAGFPDDYCYLGNPDNSSVRLACTLPGAIGRRLKSNIAYFHLKKPAAPLLPRSIAWTN